MRKLIYPCTSTFHHNWQEEGLDSPYTYESVDCDTMSILEKECYVICGPSSSRSSKYRICKGFFHKHPMYGICFSGYEVDKNDTKIGGCGVDSYCPRYTWGDFLEFLELPIISRNKLTALIFDNYNEAKECLDNFLKFKKDKHEKYWKAYINSPEIINEYNTKLNDIINCFDKLTDKTENINMIRNIYDTLDKCKLL